MDYLRILKQYWGYDAFRDLQEDIIRSIGQGHDTLGLMPTGGGKSITFQVPALAKEGICVVVTPLIALMKDQVQNLRQRGIKAQAVYSGMTRREIIVALENCIFGNFKFLYVSPERLNTEIFTAKLQRMQVSMLVVDESHCISQWGYDFRPAYLEIGKVRKLLPGVPVLALTATATPAVVKDIQEKLGFARENVFRMSFARKNLAYVVRKTDNKNGELLHILRRMPGSAIVYVRNRRKTKEIAELLVAEGITADFYHAGINNDAKDLRQRRWQNNESRVIVATNAFGMGIDKPDVRVVVHMDLPDSPEAYFQEAGRAGRDGATAYAIILYAGSDKTTLHKRIPDTFPDKDYVKQVYECLQYYYQMAMGDGAGCIFPFNLEEFCRRFKYFPVQADSALKILDQAGYIEYTEEQENSSRLMFILRRDELYRLGEMGKEAEHLIRVVLRSYTGLFTDYAYINEETLAIRAEMNHVQVYELLKMLSKRRIIDYIPHKKTPFIIYKRERVDLKHLQISKSVYEDRKARYEKRIAAMVNYVTAEEKCRSRLLLDYFGESNAADCTMCDACVQRRKHHKPTPETRQALQTRIANELAKTPLTMAQLADALSSNPSAPPVASREALAETVRSMLEEEVLVSENGLLRKK